MLKEIFTKTSDYTGYSYGYLLKQRHKIALSVIAGCLMIGIVSTFALGVKSSNGNITKSKSFQRQLLASHLNQFDTESIVVTTNLLKKNSSSILEQTAEQNKKARLAAEAQAAAQIEENARMIAENQESVRLSRGGENLSNSSEVELLEKVVMAEAGAEPYEGQIAVANVVLNRIRSGHYPKTVKGVISQSSQFTSYSNKSIFRVTPTQSVKKAVNEAISGKQIVPASTLYFINKKTAKDLTIAKSQTFVIKIGNHSFYK